MGTPLKLSEYSAVLRDMNVECVCCETPLNTDRIDMYDHKYGWQVAGEASRQWLSIKCTKCNYENSISKLGVERDIDVEKLYLTI